MFANAGLAFRLTREKAREIDPLCRRLLCIHWIIATSANWNFRARRSVADP